MLKELRIAKGFTQEEMAEMLDIARISYIRYETKERTPPLKVFNAICEVLRLNNKEKVELMRSFEKGD